MTKLTLTLAQGPGKLEGDLEDKLVLSPITDVAGADGRRCLP